MELTLGQEKMAKGYVGLLISYLGKSADELDDAIGYQPGTLSSGYALGLLCESVGPREYLLRGYTHASGGKYSGDDKTTHTNLRNSLKTNPHDKKVWDRILESGAAMLSGKTGEKIVKAFPNRQSESYPAGRGIPQWELTVPKRFLIVAIVRPGEKIARAPDGKIVALTLGQSPYRTT